MLKNNFKETNWEVVIAIVIGILLTTGVICSIVEATFTINLSNIVWLIVGAVEIVIAVLALYLTCIYLYNKKQK